METDRICIIRKTHSSRAWCTECGRKVDMVGLKEAEAISGITQPSLSDSTATRGWHWANNKDGSPLICLESVFRPAIKGDQQEQ